MAAQRPARIIEAPASQGALLLDARSISVAFNATPLLSPLTGIGKYIVELCRALQAGGGIDAHSFYRFRWRHEVPTVPYSDERRAGHLVDAVKAFVPLRRTLRRSAHHMGFVAGLRKHGIELYHEPNYVPLSYAVPVVITIHDLSWLHFPQSHPGDRVRWLSTGLPEAVERAEQILVDSEFIRDEVLTVFGVDTERVHTAPLGVSPEFTPMPPARTWPVLDALGLVHGRYILTVATIEPRKNLSHLLEAYALLPSALRERFPLVVAGAHGWHSAKLVSRLRRLEEAAQVRFLGHVQQRFLPSLYAGAVLFAFPSLYEGFGLPPLEAMASGAPVLVSNRASLPEVVGDAGECFEPDDPVATAERLCNLLEAGRMREAMAQRGIERAAQFTWERCAEKTHAIYRKALGHTANVEAPVPVGVGARRLTT